MPPTELNDSAVFYADWMLPLSRARLRSGTGFLRRGGDAETFWGPVVSRTGGVGKLAPQACDAPSLLAALDEYWSQRGDAGLRQLSPGLLKLLRAAPARPVDAEEQAAVAEFVYPLF